MSDGRTVWWAKDTLWSERERIMAIGEDFGADGPMVIDWLSSRAKLQNDGGRVKVGYRALSRGSFVPLERLPVILSRCVTVGLLHDLSESEGIIACRISGWQQDQERGRAAIRQARSRSSKPKADPDPDPLSRSVTGRHGESPREENSSTTTTPRAGLRERIEGMRDVCRPFGYDLDEITAANVLERFPSVADPVGTTRGCVEWLRAHPGKPLGPTLHRFFEVEARKAADAPAGRSKEQRAADDLAALERLSGRGA